jgi:hypothetical protein
MITATTRTKDPKAPVIHQARDRGDRRVFGGFAGAEAAPTSAATQARDRGRRRQEAKATKSGFFADLDTHEDEEDD